MTAGFVVQQRVRDAESRKATPFFRYVLSVAENGVSDDLAASFGHTDNLLTKLTAAQLETIAAVTALDNAITEIKARR